MPSHLQLTPSNPTLLLQLHFYCLHKLQIPWSKLKSQPLQLVSNDNILPSFPPITLTQWQSYYIISSGQLTYHYVDDLILFNKLITALCVTKPGISIKLSAAVEAKH